MRGDSKQRGTYPCVKGLGEGGAAAIEGPWKTQTEEGKAFEALTGRAHDAQPCTTRRRPRACHCQGLPVRTDSGSMRRDGAGDRSIGVGIGELSASLGLVGCLPSQANPTARHPPPDAGEAACRLPPEIHCGRVHPAHRAPLPAGEPGQGSSHRSPVITSTSLPPVASPCCPSTLPRIIRREMGEPIFLFHFSWVREVTRSLRASCLLIPIMRRGVRGIKRQRR